MKQEVAEAIIRWEDHDDVDHFRAVTEEKITGGSRWSKFYAQVYKDTRDDTFWEILWSRGATEYQDEGAQDIEVR